MTQFDSTSASAAKIKPRRALIIAVSGICLAVASLAVAYRVVQNLRRDPPTVCEESPIAERKFFTITPADGEAAAPLDQLIRLEVAQEGATLAAATVSEKNIGLIRVSDRTRVPASVTVAADGRAMTITPKSPLQPQTNYSFYVSQGAQDSAGQAVPAFQTAFSTSPATPLELPRFEQVPLPATAGLGITCVAVGPDGRLWAAVDDGRILRFDIAADGTLSNKQESRSLIDANRGIPRLIGGFAFDPASTPDNPIIWVTHTSFGFINMGDWQGAVSRLSGPDLEKVEPVVVGFPRSARDHILHQPSFGPDGCLYFQSGSMSSYGLPDGFWGWRKEHPLGAAVIKIDPKKLPAQLPLNVKTREDGGDYDCHSPDAPVTPFASGMRVAFDICWHSSGHLFAAVNGSSQGGNAPAGPGVPMLWTVPDSEHDWLFRVEAGGYYGHPNPSMGHYVLNGGNPTDGPDFAEQAAYPVGTQPDKDWHPAVYDFGTHVSPNGTMEYHGTGPLDHALVICRYNVGNDLLAIKIDEKGEVAGVIANVPGWGDLQNPLDVCQDVQRGNLYVSEYGKHALTLLRKK